MECSDKKYVRIICQGAVIVCGDTEQEVNDAAEDALQNDPRCQNMTGGGDGSGSPYAKFAPPGSDGG